MVLESAWAFFNLKAYNKKYNESPTTVRLSELKPTQQKDLIASDFIILSL
jgi:hypothetical protein